MILAHILVHWSYISCIVAYCVCKNVFSYLAEAVYLTFMLILGTLHIFCEVRIFATMLVMSNDDLIILSNLFLSFFKLKKPLLLSPL